MNNKIIKKIAILLVCTLFVLYISNYIVVKLDAVHNNKNVLEKIDDFTVKEKDKVYFNMSNIALFNDIMNSVYFYGCAVVETVENNKNRDINIYFVSENDRYMIKPTIEYNEMWNPSFIKLNVREDGKPCYSTNFSTINMKNGEYRIYIEVYENKHNYGLVETDFVLEKKNKKLEVSKYQESKKNNDIDIYKTVNMQYGVDKSADNKVCTLTGYAFFKDNYTLGEEIYIGVLDSYENEVFYETKQMKRVDVGQYFKDSKLTDSGFTTSIRVNKIRNCELSSVVIYKDGKYFKSNKK